MRLGARRFAAPRQLADRLPPGTSPSTMPTWSMRPFFLPLPARTVSFAAVW